MTTPEMTEPEILKQLSPWILACAVGAMNRSIYGSVGSTGQITFPLWLRLVNKDDWTFLPCNEYGLILEALTSFANRHKHEHMVDVLKKLQSGDYR